MMKRLLFTVALLLAAASAHAQSYLTNNPFGTGWVGGINTDWSVTNNVPTCVSTNPCVDDYWGIVSWSTIEASDGVFTWTLVDNLVNRGITDGKFVSLGIVGGPRTPSWLYGDDATAQFTFIPNASTGGLTQCVSGSIPVPYNTTFLTKWDAMIAALRAHLDATFPNTWQPVVKFVLLYGIGNQAVLAALPSQNGQNGIGSGATICTGSPATGACCSNNDTLNWITAGYTRTKVENAFVTIATQMRTSFPNTAWTIDIGQNWPPIDQNGTRITTAPNATDSVILSDLPPLLAALGANPVWYNDGAAQTFFQTFISQAQAGINTGYQEAATVDLPLPTMIQNQLNLGAGTLDGYDGANTGICNVVNQAALCGMHEIAKNPRTRW